MDPAVGKALTVFQTYWESTMVDTCVVTRTTDRGPLNPTTLAYTSPTVVTVYSGPCRVRPRSGSPTEVDAGEQQTTQTRYDVVLPDTATDIQPDDMVAVTSSDPYLDGTSLRVVAVVGSSMVTHRQVECVADLGSGSP